MKRYLNVILVCCLALIMVGCTPKVVDPDTKNDPFVLGKTPMTSYELWSIYSGNFKSTYPLSEEILATKSWIKTNQMTKTLAVMTLTDQHQYVYSFYKVTGRYLVVIKNQYQNEFYRYLVSEQIFDQIKVYICENYMSGIPGIYPYSKAMLGNDETTLFDVDLTMLESTLKPSIFVPKNPVMDLSRIEVLFSLIDDRGNVYRFYRQVGTVVVKSAENQIEKQYDVRFETISEIWTFITETYPEALITNQLKPVLFTKVYPDGLSTFTNSQLIPIQKTVSDSINQRLMLNGVYKPGFIPDADSACAYVLKDSTGLYYVVCYNPYVIGVGKDPKGPLTYYSLGDPYRTDIGTQLNLLPMDPPAGSRVDGYTYTKANVIMHCECDRHVDFTSAQNRFLVNLMDLQNHSSVTYDNSSFYSEPYVEDLFALTTSNGRFIRFYIVNTSKTILFTIDYNGYEKGGLTYYRVDDSSYENVLEAHFYIAGLIDTVKADAAPTYDAFFIGDQQAYPKLPDVPMTVLTNEQITKIDALLQRSSWQYIALYDNAIDLKSKFVLRKDSTSFYIFSQFGSLSVVTLRSTDKEEKVYLIPNKALNDVLTALKTMK